MDEGTGTTAYDYSTYSETGSFNGSGLDWGRAIGDSACVENGQVCFGSEVVKGGYRYAFNGKERDDEVKGSGNSYTTEFRQYDPRLGRWLSVDPLMKKYASLSPYNYVFNNPINLVDIYGNGPGKEKIQKEAKKVAKAIDGTSKQCSQGARMLLWALTGSRDLYSKGSEKINQFHHPDGGMEAGKTTANDMIKHISKSSNYEKIDNLDDAIKEADKGELVFAVWENSDGHGHINVILSSSDYFGNWDNKRRELPLMFDTGGGNRFPDENTDESHQTINYTYGPEKQPNVKFYKWTGKSRLVVSNKKEVQKNTNLNQTTKIKSMPEPKMKESKSPEEKSSWWRNLDFNSDPYN